MLFFIKNGVLLGSKSLFGIEIESSLFTLGAILGMVYVYLPFMLFHDAQRRHGAKRYARGGARSRRKLAGFREVELPLSMPGILIGCLLTFVLAVGAIAEAKISAASASSRSRMTSRSPSPIRRTAARAALAVLLMLLVGVLVISACAASTSIKPGRR